MYKKKKGTFKSSVTVEIPSLNPLKADAENESEEQRAEFELRSPGAIFKPSVEGQTYIKSVSRTVHRGFKAIRTTLEIEGSSDG